jgi:quinol monooxygenase YgiN
MAASVHVVARFLAKPGQEQALKAVLITLVPPTRRELGCYQSDLLESVTDPLDFCFVERWEDEKSFQQHADSPHVKTALADSAPLVAAPPDIRRYHVI